MPKTIRSVEPAVRVFHLFTQEDEWAFIRMHTEGSLGYSWYSGTFKGFDLILDDELDAELEALYEAHKGETS